MSRLSQLGQSRFNFHNAIPTERRKNPKSFRLDLLPVPDNLALKDSGFLAALGMTVGGALVIKARLLCCLRGKRFGPLAMTGPVGEMLTISQNGLNLKRNYRYKSRAFVVICILLRWDIPRRGRPAAAWYVIGGDGMGYFPWILRVRPGLSPVRVVLLALALALSLACLPFSLPSGGNPIVFVSDSDGDPEIFLLDPESGETVRLTNNRSPDGSPRWSPDGARIAYVSEESGDAEINVVDKEGAQFNRLTNNPGTDGSPLWSPTEEKLAFVSEAEEKGEAVTEIYSIDIEGGQLSRVTFNTVADELGGWSPDGEWIVFYHGDSGEDRGLWLRNPAGVNLVQLTEEDDSQPVWSPDGRYIAFVRQQGDTADIYVARRLDGGSWNDGVEVTRLTQGVTDDHSPAWRPNSKILAFVSYRDGNPEIYTVQADGANQQRLTSNSADDLSPVWSPDGKQLAFVTYLYGTADILVMNADGSGQRRLTNNEYEDTNPDW